MPTKISRYIFILLFILMAAVYLPEFYWKIFGRRPDYIAVQYSPIVRQFVIQRTLSYMKTDYFDLKGNSYSQIEFEKLLPFHYYLDLDKWNILPEKVQNIPIDISTIRKKSQHFFQRPVNLHDSSIQLFPLFGSELDFARIVLPDEVFRINDRMEFIDVRKNIINEGRTSDFTAALKNAGFAFPAKIIAGNPTIRKPFDEGYFIVDAAGSVFHVKTIKNKPFCKKTAISPDLGIRYISIAEDQRREFYGYLFTNSDEVYLITYDNYKLIRLPLKDFNADEMTLRFFADPLYRVISYFNSEKTYGVVTDLKYNLVDSCFMDMVPFEKTMIGRIDKGMFPFKIETESENSIYKSFRLRPSGNLGLIGMAVSLLLFVFIKYVYRREKLSDNPLDLVIVALTGIYGLLAVLVIRPEIWDKSADPFGY